MFHLYDPEIINKITDDARKIMVETNMKLNEILAGGCKPGELVVLCASANSGKSYYKDILAQEIKALIQSQDQLSNENDNG